MDNSDQEIVLVSACLLGVPCRYDGQAKPCAEIIAMAGRIRLLPVCPEQLGGLPTPRSKAERVDDRIVTADGQDVTAAFQRGAEITVALAKQFGVRRAILRRHSPSCGCHHAFDGSFSGKFTAGDGVTVQALKRAGIQCESDESHCAGDCAAQEQT